MYGQVEPTDQDPRTASGRHRGRRKMSAPVALGLSVLGLLSAFGAGAALLPASLTGPGSAAERPEAAVAALAPGAGGGAPGAGASAAPSAPAPASPSAVPSAAPTTSVTAKPKATVSKKPQVKKTTAPAKATPKVAAGMAGQEAEVSRLTNVERGKAGCGSVKLNTKLRTAMRSRSGAGDPRQPVHQPRQ